MRRFSFWPCPYWYRRWHSTRCACPPPWPRGGLGQAGCARFAPGAGQCSKRRRCGCARRRTAGPAGSSTSRLCSGGFRRSRSVLRWRRSARWGPSASPGPHPSVPPRPRPPDGPHDRARCRSGTGTRGRPRAARRSCSRTTGCAASQRTQAAPKSPSALPRWALPALPAGFARGACAGQPRTRKVDPTSSDASRPGAPLQGPVLILDMENGELRHKSPQRPPTPPPARNPARSARASPASRRAMRRNTDARAPARAQARGARTAARRGGGRRRLAPRKDA